MKDTAAKVVRDLAKAVFLIDTRKRKAAKRSK